MQLVTTDSKIPFWAIQGVGGKVKKASQGFDRRCRALAFQ